MTDALTLSLNSDCAHELFLRVRSLLNRINATIITDAERVVCTTRARDEVLSILLTVLYAIFIHSSGLAECKIEYVLLAQVHAFCVIHICDSILHPLRPSVRQTINFFHKSPMKCGALSQTAGPPALWAVCRGSWTHDYYPYSLCRCVRLCGVECKKSDRACTL